MHPPVSDYLRALGIVSDDYRASAPPDGAPTYSRAIAQVRPRRYDICILPFPATRWQYAALARGAGAKQLVLHEYGGAASADRADDAQRARPDCAAGIASPRTCALPRAAGLPPGSGDLGILGSGVLEQHAHRRARSASIPARWLGKEMRPSAGRTNTFVALALRTLRADGRCDFFSGRTKSGSARAPSMIFVESRESTSSASRSRRPPRLLAECEVFVGNDAGFSHLASGLGVKTLALYGMTSEVRGAPIGQAVALRPSLCPACHDEGSAGFRLRAAARVPVHLAGHRARRGGQRRGRTLRSGYRRAARGLGRSIQALRKGVLVKEETAPASASLELRWPQREC